MEFHDLEVFLAVAQEKSFSRAAKRVLRTQPAVSLAVRRLEDELATPLFDRSDKEPVLTDSGEVLRTYAERLLNLRQEIPPALGELKDLHRGHIRVGANETGALFLLPFIKQFTEQNPQVRVHIIRTYARDIPKELLNRNLDLGILSYNPGDAKITSSVVYLDRLAFVVYPRHRLARQKRVSISGLGRETFAAHNVRSPYRDRLLQAFRKHGVPLNIDIELPTVESIKRLVQMEQAVALIPRICLDEELHRGDLVEVEIDELRIERKLRVGYRRGDSLSHAARSFLQLLGRTEDRPATLDGRPINRVAPSRRSRGGKPVDLRSRSSV